MRNYWKMILFVIIYGSSCIFMLLKEGDFLYPMLVWNVMLSTVPLFMIRYAAEKENVWMKRLFMFLWILFLPNAFYMITDFIHITNHPMIWVIPVEPYSGLTGTRYSMDAYLWVRLLIISLGAFYALLAALESTRVFLGMIDTKRSAFRRTSSLFLISLLSGTGIYIGRFLRFNSWDILNPVRLIGSLIRSADAFSISFILIYTVFILSTFLVFSMFHPEVTERYLLKSEEKTDKDIS